MSEPGRLSQATLVQAGLKALVTMTYAPMLMVFAIAALVAAALVLLPSLIAPRRLTPVKAEPFECGKDAIEVAEGKFAIKFSTIAIFFISSTSSFCSSGRGRCSTRQLGWFGFVEMLVFLGILMLGFVYIWRKGGLNGSRRLLHEQLDEAIGWARKYSHLPVPVRDGVLRDGVHGDGVLALRRGPLRRRLPRFSPRQADVLFVVGTISHKIAPVLKRIYDQMTEPKWVVAFGVCTCTGGFYDNYATVQGIDTIMPVDIYIPGCPPRPERSSTV